MSWRIKLWFFNSGASAILALMTAITGSSFCFLFGALAILDWHIGNLAIEQNTKGE